MRKVMIISPCVSCKQRNLSFESEFHFRGYFQGQYLKKIRLLSRESFEVSEEYLLYVSVEKVWNHVLYGELIKLKSIKQMRVSL